MNLSPPRAALMAALLISAVAVSIPAQTVAALDDEIAQLRKELNQTQADAQRVSQEIEKDKKDFADYRTRAAQKLQAAGAELEGVKADVAKQSRANDSLGSRIAQVQAESRQIDMAHEEFRMRLIALCNEVQPSIRRLSPLLFTQTQSALALLTNDLSTKSVDNMEGCTRLIQILSRLDDATSTIQIAQETSPVSEIRGMAYRLRIGTFFEAVVDTKGEKCAIFEGWNPDGSARWKSIEGSAMAQAVLAAVSIREGKALPAFVELPLAATLAPAPVSAAAAQGGAK